MYQRKNIFMASRPVSLHLKPAEEDFIRFILTKMQAIQYQGTHVRVYDLAQGYY